MLHRFKTFKFYRIENSIIGSKVTAVLTDRASTLYQTHNSVLASQPTGLCIIFEGGRAAIKGATPFSFLAFYFCSVSWFWCSMPIQILL